MSPIDFPQANARLGPPAELEESQCHTITAYVCDAIGGSCDGTRMVVVAWKPSEEERMKLADGAPIFLTCLGGLLPHFLTTSFDQATNPA